MDTKKTKSGLEETSMICSKCKEEKDILQFNKSKHTKKGYQSWCRICKNKKENEWYHKKVENKQKRQKQVLDRIRNNKKLVIDYFGGKCNDCGGVFHPSVYDLHHRNPEEKDNNFKTMLHRSWNKIIKEIEKCDLLCANCHRIRHNADNY